MGKVINTLTGRLTPELRRNIVVAAGILGLIIIFLSSFIPGEKTTEIIEQPSESVSVDYKQALEKELEEILGNIEGAGRVKVMVTLDAMGEDVFAVDKSESASAETTDSSGGRTQRSEENEYVIIRSKDGSEQAVLKKQRLPEVRGVLIVCEGGGSAVVRERVTAAAATALGTAVSNVAVEQMPRGQQ